MRMKYCVSLCLSHTRHKLLRVCSSVELLVNFSKLSYSPTKPTSIKRMIQFDLDESCHVIRSVLEQFRDDYVICLPLVTCRH